MWSGRNGTSLLEDLTLLGVWGHLHFLKAGHEEVRRAVKRVTK